MGCNGYQTIDLKISNQTLENLSAGGDITNQYTPEPYLQAVGVLWGEALLP